MEKKEILLNMELSVEGSRHIVGINGCYFQIGKILFEVLRYRQKEYGWKKIASLLESHFQITIPTEKLENVFDSKMTQIIEKVNKKRSSYIYCKVAFISKFMIERLTVWLIPLFKKKTFYSTGLLSITVTLFYFMFALNYSEIINSVDGQLSELSSTIFFLYIISISIMILHELGHATASRYFGIQSSSIGFGFYIIFPVFFTDVTRIWVLKAKDRIVVNLGGVYFQLIVNIILITFSLSLENNFPTLKLATDILITSNTFIILASLNPFLRNDGYWILCDYFNIYNLMEKVMIGPFNFFKTFFLGKRINKKMLPVIIYGTINYFIFGFIGFLIVSNIENSLLKITDLNFLQELYKSFTVEKLLILFKAFFSIIICSIYTLKVFKMLLRKKLFTINNTNHA